MSYLNNSKVDLLFFVICCNRLTTCECLVNLSKSGLMMYTTFPRPRCITFCNPQKHSSCHFFCLQRVSVFVRVVRICNAFLYLFELQVSATQTDEDVSLICSCFFYLPVFSFVAVQ